ncbi:MAG: UDP-N-acetylmuramate dehydrogenase [Gammaproteobacteria bacterium]|nr:UDP-N-acetylmuramate dehydrogenase [Gammaproteobacteria bacterium]MDH5614297.1 UDP-N-acetylmuramate dehydrogenase [Gammaproteobacteria bacterium]
MTKQKRTPSTWHGTLLYNEPMARHTSWRAGGNADRFYKPTGINDLAEYLKTVPEDEPLYWVGLGSNLLVRDDGIRGTVICTSGVVNTIEERDGLIYVESGVSCAKTARFTARLGLVGAEFLSGIPGTMGGALAMNAGAFGGETWPLVARVETMNRYGERFVRKPDEYKVGYRHVEGPEGEWFIAAWLKLEHGDAEAGTLRIKELLAKRNESQPVQTLSCGSVFRNPEGNFAARLIEECGLKGACIGGASVSEKHANFIVNTGDATAKDIELLINKVRDTVAQQKGIKLEPEVHIIGEPRRGYPDGGHNA